MHQQHEEKNHASHKEKPKTLSAFWAIVLTLLFGGALIYGLGWSIYTRLIEPIMRAFQ
ncbi:MAG: hypothetical protein IKZ20_01125 [Bacteroidaceae bacterium]|nr:hypothetical protein [Bacteroidaceae bacterium]MBQ5835349.1 hypothetical protein [Bacteroidaceae bacterium]MBQ5909094.1 hypothetical protein [Bacteroidaceae bacterium]MBR4935753.1 hypothetical protein [Bacteroidaceae bacterium]MBR5530637.1 hypothetical protein [Bacteroidaceae bacterium]